MEGPKNRLDAKVSVSFEEGRKKMLQYLGDGDFEKLEAYFEATNISPELIKDSGIQAKVDEWLATFENPEMKTIFPEALREKVGTFLQDKFKS